MIDIHRFIKMLSVITINVRDKTVKQDRTTDKAEGTRDRAYTCDAIHAGHRNSLGEQEAHRRGFVCRVRCILQERGTQDATGESHKGSCREKEQSKAKDTNASNHLISIPSFLFSYQFYIILQSIDDICLQINPTLLGMIIGMYQ